MECNKKVSADINQFMEEAGLNEAFLLGGAVLDPLVKKDAKVNDYDVCVKDPEVFYETLSKLEATGCNISEVMRTHNVYAVIRHPILGQIDFSCMNPENNGIFNIEKIYAKFRRTPEGIKNEVVDKYGAIYAAKSGRVRIACNKEEEGAYNILRRFLAIAGKYNLDLSKNGVNNDTIQEIKAEFSNMKHYITQDRVRCLSRLPASIKRAENKKQFVSDLGKQQIFAVVFPEINRLFNKGEFINDEKLTAATTQKDVLYLMVKHTNNSKERDELVDCLSILSKREAARQDKGVKSFLEGLSSEQTSKYRLHRDILPLLISLENRRG